MLSITAAITILSRQAIIQAIKTPQQPHHRQHLQSKAAIKIKRIQTKTKRKTQIQTKRKAPTQIQKRKNQKDRKLQTEYLQTVLL